MKPEETSNVRGRLRSFSVWAALAAALLAEACGGTLYKVKPVVEAPITDAGRGAEAGGLKVSAVPLLTDEESQELFESNLPLAGLLPVRVEIINNAGSPVAFKRLRFTLRDGAGASWKSRTPKQAVSRVLKADDVTLYNPAARRKFETQLAQHAFNTSAPINAGERRRGLVFFDAAGKKPVESPRGLVLRIEGLPQPLEVRLN